MAEATRNEDTVTLELSVDEAILVQVLMGTTSNQRQNEYQNRASDVFYALEEVLDWSTDEERRWARAYEAACDDNYPHLPTIRFTGEVYQ